MPITLVAVSGMSPAIITETLWALSRENPPVVPDEIIVITTSKGAQDLQSQLLTPLKDWNQKSVWQHLRQDILQHAQLPTNSTKLQLNARVITLPDKDSGIRTPATDIRTQSDNEQAADFIVQTLTPIARAQDQHLIASIAGGRKTMGALLYAAMSLLAKESDRATHVLVTAPFDNLRGFYYPTQPTSAPLHNQSTLSKSIASRATIELANIPFVPLRNKFEELEEYLTFEGLVSTYSRAPKPELKGPPKLELDVFSEKLTVEQRAIDLRGRDLLICAFLYRRAKQKLPHFANKQEAATALEDFNAYWKNKYPDHQATSRLSAGKVTTDDIPKVLTQLRKKLQHVGLHGFIPYLAPERARIGFDISKS